MLKKGVKRQGETSLFDLGSFNETVMAVRLILPFSFQISNSCEEHLVIPYLTRMSNESNALLQFLFYISISYIIDSDFFV